ncbi:MAG: hypothetical protein KatS3mg076_1186 [Candidatus Binatia bacterium]|nr:MAG: hypothetical protein KatS3mg076_1186 [Candidatus Binatia bacterium]
MSPITEHLYIGEYPRTEDIPWLKERHGIGAVASLQDDADLASKDLELRALEQEYRANRIVFRRFPVADGDVEALAQRLGTILDGLVELQAGGTRVYVHCNAGMNRAPTVAIAYLHFVEGLGLDEAVEFVKRKRPCVPYLRAIEAARSCGHLPRGRLVRP